MSLVKVHFWCASCNQQQPVVGLTWHAGPQQRTAAHKQARACKHTHTLSYADSYIKKSMSALKSNLTTAQQKECFFFWDNPQLGLWGVLWSGRLCLCFSTVCECASVCVRDQAEGFIRYFISRQWEMFGPASHLWLGDKSLSVTQLEQTPLQFFFFFFLFEATFSFYILKSHWERKNEWALRSGSKCVYTWSCPARHKNASCEPAITLRWHFFLLIKQQAGSEVRWVHTRSALPALLHSKLWCVVPSSKNLWKKSSSTTHYSW